MSLTMADLFTDSPSTPNQHAAGPQLKMDLLYVSFRFELAALDRRLRAERVLKAATNFTIEGLTGEKLDLVIDSIAHIYADQDRAEFLETVADNLRLKAYAERTTRHAA